MKRLLLLAALTTALRAQSTSIVNLGTLPASAPATGLGFNVTQTNDWEFQQVASNGGKHVRFQCAWVSEEVQSAPPANTSSGFTLDSGCSAGLTSAARYGLEATVVAAYGPPFHKVLTVSNASATSIGATSVTLTFVSGVGGETMANLVADFKHFFTDPTQNVANNVLSQAHTYAGVLITGVTVIDSTHATVTLASALVQGWAANTQFIINEQLYTPMANASPTEASVLRYVAYAQFIANACNTAGTTCDIELWNEPPWPDDSNDNRRDLYDTDPGTSGELAAGHPNFGIVAALQAAGAPPAGVTYTWAGTNKSGFNSVLGSSMSGDSGVAFTEPNNGVFGLESIHPYGTTPEDLMWNQVCLNATIATYPAGASNGIGCNLNSTSSIAYYSVQQNLTQKTRGAAYGLGHSVTETGEQQNGFSNGGTEARRAIFMPRQYLGYELDGLTPIEFYRFYDAGNQWSFVSGSGTGATPLASLTALSGIVSDLSAFSLTPATPGTLATVNSYSGTFPLNVGHFIGKASGATLNTDMMVVYQMSNSTTWSTDASPTAVSVPITIPTGYSVASTRNLSTRSLVSTSQTGSVLTVPVSDAPIGITIVPTVVSVIAPINAAGNYHF